MDKGIFYHAGCPVCVSAEQSILNLADTSKYTIEVVHLGTERQRIAQAARQGVKSVPALVLNNSEVLHINFGASLNDLKN